MAKVATTSTKAKKDKAASETSAKSKSSTLNPAPKPAAKAASKAAVAEKPPIETSVEENKTTTAPKATTKQVEKSSQVTFELISVRAFELFAQRGYVHGFDREDWIEAEKQLKTESFN